jgi:hypothetical protein
MSFIYSVFLCLFVYGTSDIPVTLERLNNCSALVNVSQEYKIDPFIVSSVMLSESTGITPKPRYKRSPRGPMQVTPYWCKNQTFKECDLIRSGVRALVLIRRCGKIDWVDLECSEDRFSKRPWDETLCIYNQNKSCSDSQKAHGYSRHILHRAKKIKQAIRRGTL